MNLVEVSTRVQVPGSKLGAMMRIYPLAGFLGEEGKNSSSDRSYTNRPRMTSTCPSQPAPSLEVPPAGVCPLFQGLKRTACPLARMPIPDKRFLCAPTDYLGRGSDMESDYF